VLSIGQGGVFWRDALRTLDGRPVTNKAASPLFQPRSQIRIMHHLSARNLVSAAMDNSDGLLPTLAELAERSAVGIEIDLDLLRVPEAEAGTDEARLWLGWGDWNVLACVRPNREEEVRQVVTNADGVVVRIGAVISSQRRVTLRRGGRSVPAPRLESERFARDSWMTRGIEEYVRLLRSAPLP
jgi:thiamine-monophosphate kinase